MTARRPAKGGGDGPAAALGPWDAASLLVGIVIGTAIFRSSGAVFRSVNAPWEGLALWAAGGALSFAGALCYAELASAYPRSGGDYEYLSRAYGRWLGLQFAWAQLVVVLTGSVGSMAYAFADYAVDFWRLDAGRGVWLALLAIALLTLTNLLGLRAGKTTQNVLTALKLAGLALIAALGLTQGDWTQAAVVHAGGERNIGLAMVFVLYAYAGWSHAAYVAARVRNVQRNLPRALVCGVAAVTLIYLVVNLSYVLMLGFQGAQASQTPATDAVRAAAGDWPARLVSVVVMLSAMGAINGTILTGAHMLAELGRDYRGLAWLSPPRLPAATPSRALLLEAAVAGLLVLGVGTGTGRGLVDAASAAVGLPPVPWEMYHGGFDTLVAASAPLYWGFLLLTGTSVFVLRRRDPDAPRPFRIPFYPVTPLAFCAACGYMLYAAVTYARGLTLLAVLPIGSAALISWLHRRDDGIPPPQ